MAEEQDCTMFVRQDGHDYFQVDLDRRKGDRRSDRKLNGDCFGVEESSVTDNVRVSQRLQMKKSRKKLKTKRV
jgi:hypothetical protein